MITDPPTFANARLAVQCLVTLACMEDKSACTLWSQTKATCMSGTFSESCVECTTRCFVVLSCKQPIYYSSCWLVVVHFLAGKEWRSYTTSCTTLCLFVLGRTTPTHRTQCKNIQLPLSILGDITVVSVDRPQWSPLYICEGAQVDIYFLFRWMNTTFVQTV